ncbi:hypothetical protein [Kitasatospora sp. NPDC058046]|uniref:hypothetical protein n=1 Tax=Kitasatospora sp. NPDC058046 TaxID=3346312 RepID=UPI0036D9BAD2
MAEGGMADLEQWIDSTVSFLVRRVVEVTMTPKRMATTALTGATVAEALYA